MFKKIPHLKIGSKLMFSMTSLIIVVIVSISLLIGLRIQKNAEQSAQELAKETAYHYGYLIKSELEVAMDEARSLASLLESTLAAQGFLLSRREVNAMLKYFIEHHPNFLATYVVFDPEAFDGKDINFVEEWGHDKTGRFIPYWSRDEQGEGELEPVGNYELESGEHYQKVKERKKEVVTDPYYYPVQGEEKFMTSLLVPLFKQEEVIGLVGIDINFQGLQEEISQLKISTFKEAFATLFASNGTIIATKDVSQVGQHVSEVVDNKEFTDFILKMEPFVMKRYSKTLNTEVISYGAPLEIGQTNTRWMVAVNISEEELAVEAKKTIFLIALIGLIGAITGIVVSYLLSKTVSTPLNKLVSLSQAIAEGNLSNDIVWRGQDEIGKLLRSFDRMQTQLRERLFEEKRVANEALRINHALHNVNTCVLIADNHYKIIYMNQSAHQFFKDKQTLIRKIFPDFEVGQLLGGSVDKFHQNPTYQYELLEQLTTTHNATIKVGELSWDIKVNPVRNAEGQRLGWVAEFYDRTAEIATEQEVSAVMTAASLGDFKQRIDLTDKTGFFKTFSQHLNRTLDYTQQMVEELRSVFAALARGDLNQAVTNDYAGSLELLKNDVNTMVEKLTLVMGDIQRATQAAAQGDFDQLISLEDKDGFFATLSKFINQILETNQRIVGDLQRVFAALARGDLSQMITQEYAGSLERLRDDVNATVVTLTHVITTVKQSAEVVTQAAEEISQGNANLSHRTEEQAASLEETAASMEEMTSTVQQNSDNSQRAKLLAEKAQNHALQGGEAVNAVVMAMKQINHSSKKMSEILAVINEIAFQTNLLALNAAVEAARAGEQGRGFAVVAGEVRSLAQRSAEAAKEIKQLIEDSLGEVEDGTRLVNQSGLTLQEIVEAVKRVSNIIVDIAAASLEQNSGIQQVNKVISQLDEVTQQNAALVEEAMAASETLKEQAITLKDQVGFFSTQETIKPINQAKKPLSKLVNKKEKPMGSPLPKSPKKEEREWEDF